MMNNNFEAITFTTYGYRDFTENLLKSIISNKVDLDVNVYALDEKSEDYFNKIHNKVTNIYANDNFEDFMDQKNENFGNLMLKKFECIYDSILKNQYVLYIDSDITIKNNISKYLVNKIKNNDFVFQNDKNPKKPNQINVCAGFMFIKSNKKTLKFFNPKNVPFEKIVKFRTHDQTYINKNLAKFNYSTLPLDKFPNGPYFYANYHALKPNIIHFNYVLGEEKIELMKKYNEWYL